VPDKLEGRAKELVQDKNFAHVSVPRGDGTIQTVVVWADADDEGRIVVNSAEGRDWPRNLRRAGKATVSIANAENPYEYVTVVCAVDSDTTEDGEAVIDALAKKYLDLDRYPYHQEGEQRITFRLAPEQVNHKSA
jgi:PPOX class probable F420-dependent enzyme